MRNLFCYCKTKICLFGANCGISCRTFFFLLFSFLFLLFPFPCHQTESVLGEIKIFLSFRISLKGKSKNSTFVAKGIGSRGMDLVRARWFLIWVLVWVFIRSLNGMMESIKQMCYDVDMLIWKTYRYKIFSIFHMQNL